MSLTDHLKEKVVSLFYGVLSESVNIQLRICGHNHDNTLLTSYANDFLGPFTFYFGNKLLYETIGLPFGKSKWTNAAVVFGYCSWIELGQYIGYQKGTFDPYDFLAYAAGVGLAVGVDRLTFGKEKKKGIEELVDE